MFNWTPSRKKFHCFSLLLATAFPARWCFRSLRKQKKLCRKGCKTTNVFSRYFVQVCYLITPVNVIWAKSVEKPPGVLQLFLQSFVCIRKLQKHHVAGNAAASNKMSQLTCLQRGAQFQRGIRDQSVQLDPLVQEISLFQLVAGSGISSKMVFMQPSTAKKTLQKELRNNKCKEKALIKKWPFPFLCARAVVHCKSACIQFCCKCSYQQTAETIKILGKDV